MLFPSIFSHASGLAKYWDLLNLMLIEEWFSGARLRYQSSLSLPLPLCIQNSSQTFQLISTYSIWKFFGLDSKSFINFYIFKIKFVLSTVFYCYWELAIQFLESLKPLFLLAVNMILRFILMTAKLAEILFYFILNNSQTWYHVWRYLSPFPLCVLA